MLTLLIRTRLRYYYNFIRHHFDKRTLFEIAFIFLVLLLLLGRSPADIGYSLNFLLSPDFPAQWLNIWINCLPLLYFIFVILALYTMRPTGEWLIIGGLPFAKKVIINYHLLRYVGKTFSLTLVGTVPFLFGPKPIEYKLLHFCISLALLVILQFIAFFRAFTLRNQHQKFLTRSFSWIWVDGVVIALFILFASALNSIFTTNSSRIILILITGCALAIIMLRIIYQIYDPSLTESFRPRLRIVSNRKLSIVKKSSLTQTTALLYNDVVYLSRYKRSLLVIIFIEAILLSITSIVHDLVTEIITSCISMQILFGWIFINMLMILFERDAETHTVLRILPVAPQKIWFARWLFLTILISTPMIAPISITLIKFPFNRTFLIFSGIELIGIPATFAMLYCTTGFALFPHVKLAQNILNISILFIILFWFFMPLGSIIFVILSFIWARKSYKHFQYSEVL